MDPSLFTPLEDAGLTTLRIAYDWRRDQEFLLAAREWDEDLDWARYTKDFTHEDILNREGRHLGHAEVLALFRDQRLDGYLDRVLGLLRQGRHQGILCFFHRKKNIRFMANMHSNTLGVANGRHAIRAGGIRRHGFDDDELDVIVDGLNLGRAMSFKNAAAQIPYGGSKITVHADPIGLDDLNALGFLAFGIDRSRCFTGPDMGFVPEHADVLRAHFTKNIVGGPAGTMGPTGTPTAWGTVLALKEAAELAFGSGDLTGRSIAIQGLGAVGFPQAEYLLKEGASLIVADTDQDRVSKAVALAPDRIRAVPPDEIYQVEADVFSPTAIGGIITEERIPHFKCRIIMGAANNQLRAVSQEQEIRLARSLDRKNILYQIDWMHNPAGVIAGFEEYVNQENARTEHILPHLERVCGDAVRENLRGAKEEGITPTERAYRIQEEKIYGRR